MNFSNNNNNNANNNNISNSANNNNSNNSNSNSNGSLTPSRLKRQSSWTEYVTLLSEMEKMELNNERPTPVKIPHGEDVDIATFLG